MVAVSITVIAFIVMFTITLHGGLIGLVLTGNEISLTAMLGSPS